MYYKGICHETGHDLPSTIQGPSWSSQWLKTGTSESPNEASQQIVGMAHLQNHGAQCTVGTDLSLSASLDEDAVLERSVIGSHPPVRQPGAYDYPWPHPLCAWLVITTLALWKQALYWHPFSLSLSIVSCLILPLQHVPLYLMLVLRFPREALKAVFSTSLALILRPTPINPPF